ncbi:hypothetical protein SEA_OCTOBIEN14_11 [Gordonia phage Octobien14]|uniref:DUF3846 domain-containing protein n=1 Tax=Gordonia phage Octobien14 TaxID=2483673 RepID=A0A3G3M9R4_9CAUD|nr:hypothetical protein L3Y22_gp011 [Gordonia phage Octobien14]AYR03159.1 hypothetical protein SEA_OCTOBIEN14_11 [Gordonia phage Octobien14]
MTAQAKLLVVQPDGTAEVSTMNTDLATLKGIVGGFLEGLYAGDETFLLFNEEGKLKSLEPNHAADLVAADLVARNLGMKIAPWDVLAGPVIFCSVDEEGETRDVPGIALYAAAQLGLNLIEK